MSSFDFDVDRFFFENNTLRNVSVFVFAFILSFVLVAASLSLVHGDSVLGNAYWRVDHGSHLDW